MIGLGLVLMAGCAGMRTGGLAEELVVESIQVTPWALWYGVFYEPPIRRPVSLPNFASIPTNAVPKIGKEVRGFKLIGFEEKYKTRRLLGKDVKVDVSELTIQRGRRTAKIRKGHLIPWDEFRVRVRHTPTDKVTVLDIGESLTVAGKTYTLRSVRRKTRLCIFVCEATGEVFQLPVADVRRRQTGAKPTNNE